MNKSDHIEDSVDYYTDICTHEDLIAFASLRNWNADAQRAAFASEHSTLAIIQTVRRQEGIRIVDAVSNYIRNNVDEDGIEEIK